MAARALVEVDLVTAASVSTADGPARFADLLGLDLAHGWVVHPQSQGPARSPTGSDAQGIESGATDGVPPKHLYQQYADLRVVAARARVH